MKISTLNYQKYITNSQIMQKNCKDFADAISVACKQVQPQKQQDENDVLGIAMVKDERSNVFWGMKAKYAVDSTEENPVIYVETNYGGKNVAYNISVNDIDPSHASRLELFALCSYADDKGIGDKSTFGTYQTLKSYEIMAIDNGYFGEDVKEISTWEELKNIKLNWVKASKKVLDLLYSCNDLGQYKKGKSIMALFSSFPVNRV